MHGDLQLVGGTGTEYRLTVGEDRVDDGADDRRVTENHEVVSIGRGMDFRQILEGVF
jgi:hypothetical protein